MARRVHDYGSTVVYSLGYFVVVMFVMGLLALPLRSYSLAARVTVGGFLGQGIVSTMFFLTNWRLIEPGIWFFVLFPLGCTVIGFLLPFSVLAGLVFLHNRYSPSYPAGQCQRCGYHLRGLTEPRCPECGTPFDPTLLTAMPAK